MGADVRVVASNICYNRVGGNKEFEYKISRMKKIITTLVFTISGLILFAQNKIDTVNIRPSNNIYLDILGDASLISINYERLFFITPYFFITGKLGIGYNQQFKTLMGTSPEEKYLTLPHHITGNLGKGRHFFEFGLGGTVINGKTNQHYLFYPIVGYRLQPLKSNRINFRIFGSTPFSGLNSDEDIAFTPFGICLGVSF